MTKTSLHYPRVNRIGQILVLRTCLILKQANDVFLYFRKVIWGFLAQLNPTFKKPWFDAGAQNDTFILKCNFPLTPIFSDCYYFIWSDHLGRHIRLNVLNSGKWFCINVSRIRKPYKFLSELFEPVYCLEILQNHYNCIIFSALFLIT